MAAKGYLKIEQSEDLVSVTQLATETSAPLNPEERVLARSLFRGYDNFDFAQATPQLAKATKAFRDALLNTEYFSQHTGLSIPAWTLSALAALFALYRGNYFANGSFRVLEAVVAVTSGCFVVGVRTLSGTLEKVACRFPGSIAPRRPWTGADTKPIAFLLGSLGGISLLAIMSSVAAALLAAAFLVINGVFFYALQGPTSAGRAILAQLNDYKKFLSEVDADAISRVNSSERVPAQLSAKNAYAVAFHLDLGWGEQFVTSIAEVIECAQVFEKTSDDDNATQYDLSQ
jgi:hypothetical protein